MSEGAPLLAVDQTCEQAIAWINQEMVAAGMQVLRTFDLQLACAACSCPIHGDQVCNCQMVVLLVYGKDWAPISLMAHGYDGKTWVSIVDTPQQRADSRLESAIRQALQIPGVIPTSTTC